MVLIATHFSVILQVSLLLLLVLLFIVQDVSSLELNKSPRSSSTSNQQNRRDALLRIGTSTGIIGGGISSGILSSLPSEAAEISSQQKPIAIIGANGRTGSLCVEACLKRGIPVRALTRSGQWTSPNHDFSYNSNLLTVSSCDVKDTNAINKNVQGCFGVIYAASASKNGGTAKEIDNDGVVTTGRACVEQKIPRYVVLSSTATTRPKSLGYIFTNVMGGIMDEKRQGELGVYQGYNVDFTVDTPPSRASSYTIVRPGGLEEPKKNEILGPSRLEISQGDVLAGIISRADLAEVSVELALSTAANVQNTAVELYYTDSVQPCEKRFRSYMTNGIAPRLHGDTYDGLFQGIKPNIDYYEA
jgi:hypothetical protein